MNNSENIIVRVTPELKSALAILAAQEERSLSKVIKRILEAHISQASQPVPASQPAKAKPAKAKPAKAKPAKAKPAKVSVTYRKPASKPAKAKK